jgi:hypothetical protein
MPSQPHGWRAASLGAMVRFERGEKETVTTLADRPNTALLVARRELGSSGRGVDSTLPAPD